MPGIVFILEVYTPVREFGSGSDKKKNAGVGCVDKSEPSSSAEDWRHFTGHRVRGDGQSKERHTNPGFWVNSVSVPVLDDCQTPLRDTLRRRWWKSELKAVSLSDQRGHPHHSVNEWTPASNEFIIIKLRVGMGCWGINELLKDCFERAPNFMFVHWVAVPSIVYRIILSQGRYRPWRSPSPTHISCLMSSITSHQRSDLGNSKDKEDQSILRQLWLFEKPLLIYSTNIY